MDPRPQPLFTDALSGANGMADPAPDRLVETAFADALLAPFDDPVGGPTPQLTLPEVPLPPTAKELMTDRAGAGPAQKPAPKPAPKRVRRSTAPPVDAPAMPADHRSSTRQDRIDAYAAFLSPQFPEIAAPPPGIGRHGTVQIVRPVPRQVPQRAPQQRPAPRSAAARPAAPRPRPAVKKRSRGGGFVALFVVILFLVVSDLGREILDVIAGFLNR